MTTTSSHPTAPPILALLENLPGFHETPPGSNHFMACCPAHDDHTPSLSIGVDDDGKVLTHDFGGCAPEAVRDALGASWRDYFPNASPTGEKRYTSFDTGGKPHAHRRYYDEKGETQRPWTQSGVKTAQMRLYGAERLKDAPTGATVYLCEGEPATDALCKRGVLAVGTVCGAGVTPCDDALRDLRKFVVILWPDRDNEGREHMRKIAARLAVLGVTVAGVIDDPTAPPKGDAVDFFAHGGMVDGLAALLQRGAHEEKASSNGAHPGSNGAHPDPDDAAHGKQNEPPPADEQTPDDLLGITLDMVEVEDIEWLWERRLAQGKIAMGDGEPGLGKSLVTLDLAARVSMGASMPDGSAGLEKPAGVVIICGEDGLADTIKPRLLAAGASPAALRRVRAINLVPETLKSGAISQRLLSLVTDLAALEATITAIGAKLLIIDPITAYLGSQTDMYKDADIRAVLTPLALMAERTGVAVLLVRHLNKDEGKSALNRGMGGVAFIGVARLGLLFADNPNTEGERLMGRYKGNIGAPPPTLAYRIIQLGEVENMVKVEWLGERKINVGAALAQQSDRPSVVDDAMRFLREKLKDDDVPSTDIFEHGEAEGFSDSALNRAKRRLKVKVKKVTKDDGVTHWVWTRIPADDGQ